MHRGGLDLEKAAVAARSHESGNGVSLLILRRLECWIW
jgi:hypothetical protein